MAEINITERTFFTNYRKGMLDKHPERIELEKWGQYCYVPLDLPVYDYPEINQWIMEQSSPSVKLSGDIASPVYGAVNFDAVDVYPKGNIHSPDMWSTNPRQDFLEIFPFFVERIMDEFPFKTLPNLKFWSSNKHIHFHRDHAEFTDNPSSFRIMMFDNNPTQSLRLIESLPDTDADYGTIFPIPRIPSTNSFVWNNLRTKHGSVYKPEHRKLLLILNNAEIDVRKYDDLMERSIAKYKDFTMVSIHSTSDYLDPVSTLPN